jgi:hypothetical protein
LSGSAARGIDITRAQQRLAGTLTALQIRALP